MAERRVSDRAVLLAAIAVVIGVVAFAWVTELVPPLREALTFQPLVIGGMVAVTVAVLVLVLRPRRS